MYSKPHEGTVGNIETGTGGATEMVHEAALAEQRGQNDAEAQLRALAAENKPVIPPGYVMSAGRIVPETPAAQLLRPRPAQDEQPMAAEDVPAEAQDGVHVTTPASGQKHAQPAPPNHETSTTPAPKPAAERVTPTSQLAVDKDFFELAIHEWMWSPSGLNLGLGSAKCLVYAYVFGRSRFGDGKMECTQASLADVLCIKRPTVNRAIQKLLEDGLILALTRSDEDAEVDRVMGGRKVNYYVVNPEAVKRARAACQPHRLVCPENRAAMSAERAVAAAQEQARLEAEAAERAERERAERERRLDEYERRVPHCRTFLSIAEQYERWVRPLGRHRALAEAAWVSLMKETTPEVVMKGWDSRLEFEKQKARERGDDAIKIPFLETWLSMDTTNISYWHNKTARKAELAVPQAPDETGSAPSEGCRDDEARDSAPSAPRKPEAGEQPSHAGARDGQEPRLVQTDYGTAAVHGTGKHVLRLGGLDTTLKAYYAHEVGWTYAFGKSEQKILADSVGMPFREAVNEIMRLTLAGRAPDA